LRELLKESRVMLYLHAMQLVSFALQGVNQKLIEGRKERLNEHLPDVIATWLLQAKKIGPNLM